MLVIDNNRLRKGWSSSPHMDTVVGWVLNKSIPPISHHILQSARAHQLTMTLPCVGYWQVNEIFNMVYTDHFSSFPNLVNCSQLYFIEFLQYSLIIISFDWLIYRYFHNYIILSLYFVHVGIIKQTLYSMYCDLTGLQYTMPPIFSLLRLGLGSLSLTLLLTLTLLLLLTLTLLLW